MNFPTIVLALCFLILGLFLIKKLMSNQHWYESFSYITALLPDVGKPPPYVRSPWAPAYV